MREINHAIDTGSAQVLGREIAQGFAEDGRYQNSIAEVSEQKRYRALSESHIPAGVEKVKL